MTDLLDRITIDPAVCHAQPSIRGLRHPVSFALESLAAGITTKEIFADYEDLERDDIPAPLALGASLSRVKRIQAIGA